MKKEQGMNVDALIDMDDDEFEQAVSQAVKRRESFPEWFRLVLHPDVIDETEDVIRRHRDTAREQSRNPGKFPYADGFAKKMSGVLMEIKLHRIASGQG